MTQTAILHDSCTTSQAQADKNFFFFSTNTNRAALSVATTTNLSPKLSSDGGDDTTNLRKDPPRLADWQRQPCSEDPWSPGQHGKEKHKELLATLGDFLDKMDPPDRAAAAGPAHM